MTEASDTITPKPVLDYESARPPVPILDDGASLKSRAIRGSAWTLLGYGTSQVLSLASQIILTRLLAPELFGLIATVYVLLQGLQMFSDVGISQSVVQNPRGDDERFYNTAWTMQVFRGLLLWLCAAALTAPIASFYDEPMLRWLIPLVSLNAIIAGFNSTALYRLGRHMAFARITLLELAQQFFSIVAMLLWAWYDPSIRALVIGGFVGNSITLITSHLILRGHRSRFRWDSAAWQSLFHFGKWVFLSTALTFMAQQAGQIVIPKIFTWGQAGVYRYALLLATLPTIAVVKIGSTVAFSVYSRVQEDRSRFRSVFRRLRLPLLAGGGLIITGLIGCGPSLVRLIFDARYHEAGWMLQLLAIGAWFQILICTAESALLAAGAVNWLAGGNGAKVLSLAILIPLGLRNEPANPLWNVVLAIALSEVARYAVVAYGVRRLELPVALRDAGMTLWIAAAAGVSLLVARWLFGLPSRAWMGNGLAVIGAGMVACAFWGPVLWRAWRYANGAIRES